MDVIEPLFSRYKLSEILEWRERQALTREIDSFDPNDMLNRGIYDLIEYFIEKYKYEALRIFPDQISVDQMEIQVDQNNNDDRSKPIYIIGTRIIYFIPYAGLIDLIYALPSQFSPSPPRANVTPNSILHFIYDVFDHNVTEVKSTFEKDLKNLMQYLEWSEQDINNFNSQLPQKVQQLVEARRQKLLNDHGLVASLGFPLIKRDDAPTTFTVPITRKKIVVLPAVSENTEPFALEPTLEIKQYEEILSIMSNMSIMMERSPIAFKNMQEEHLRWHFLVQLNSLYEWQATGETFNYQGKTDILIQHNGKNIFIAECKIWQGEKILMETIDQLLHYTSWRDTKTAILFFNRNKNFTEVLKTIPEKVKTHRNFKSQIACGGEANSRYIFRHVNDPDREIIITIMAFDTP